MIFRYLHVLCLGIVLPPILSSCEKEDAPQPAVAQCRLQKETTDDGYYTLYHYDVEGNPTKIENYDPYKMTRVLDVFYDKLSLSEANKLHPMTFTTQYDAGFLTTKPSKALVSVTMDSATQVNWRTYTFHYDPRGRLTTVGEESENVYNDDEWELLVSYNDQDNVVKLVYRLTTGSSKLSTVIMVDGFDDKQTVFSGVRGYRYLMTNWDNSDPGPIITALSKNNPTSYRLIVNDVQTMNVSIVYQYNEFGFPAERIVTNSNESSKHSDRHTYTYLCL